MRVLAVGALLATACSAPDLLERDVDPSSAIRVEVFEEIVLVDGNPVDDEHLRDAIAQAHQARGSKGRCAALVSVDIQPHEDESPVDFDARRQRRKHAVLDRLVEGGVRDLQFGPPAAPPR